MSKLTLNDVSNGFSLSTVSKINQNNDLLEAALENSLSRDGSSPNAMGADLDMNSNQILNLPQAIEDTEPVRKIEFDAGVTTASQAAVDAANSAEQALIVLEAVTGIGNTVLDLPVSNSNIAIKEYVDLASGALGTRLSVKAATITTLPNSPSYTSATSTSRAKFSASTTGSLVIDGVTIADGDRVLVQNESPAVENDVYVKSTVGSKWVLTRAAELDPNNTGELFYVEGGTNAGKVFLRSDGTHLYTNTVIAGTNTDFATNGQLSVSNRRITALEAIDSTNASNIFSGTLPDARLSSVVSASTVGDATHSPVITFDAKGRITSASTATIASVTDASLLTSGTLADARLSNVIVAGSVGDSTHIPVLTYDAHGRLTAVTSTTFSVGSGTLPTTVGIVAPGSSSIVGDGVDASDQGRIETIIAAKDEIWFFAGGYKFGSDSTWPSGKVYRFFQGAYITVASGKTVQINGEFQANNGHVTASNASYIFRGSGTVKGIKQVRPEWFGALRDNSTDDYTALQNAINCAQDTTNTYNQVHILGNSGVYVTSKPLQLSPKAAVSITLEGCGGSNGTAGNVTVIKAKAGFDHTGFDSNSLLIVAGTAGDETSDFTLKNFGLTAANTDCERGLALGISAASSNGFHERLVENVSIVGLTYGISCKNFTLVKFDRVSVDCSAISGSKCVFFENGGAHVGDMDFIQCQFVAHNNSAPSGSHASWNGQCVQMANTVNNAFGIHGIRFVNCIFYNGSMCADLFCNNAHAGISDIWFLGSQFDNIVSGISINADQPSTSIDTIIIANNYFQGADGDFIVKPFGTNSAIVNDVTFQGNRTNGLDVIAGAYARFTRGFVSQGNIWGDAQCSSATIRVEECESVYTNDVTRLKSGSSTSTPVSLLTAGALLNCCFDLRAMKRGILSDYSNGSSNTNVTILKNSTIDV